jgi:hypothetical protein
MEIKTNQDLYLAITNLLENTEDTSRTLEEYLRSLWGIVEKYRNLTKISVVEFYDILSSALIENVPDFNEAWRNSYVSDVISLQGFQRFESTILAQIVDLKEMNETGKLNDKYKYFGIDSPRGSRWYNFDVSTFLERATEGTFHGWSPSRDSEVTIITMDGQIEKKDADEFSKPVIEIPEITWGDFSKFLFSGQVYE